jgi:hypothetical protein
MNLSYYLLLFSLFLVIAGSASYIYFGLFSKLFFKKNIKTTPETASSFGEFINGLTGPIFALAGFLIIYATIIDQNDINNLQQFESRFFKNLDFNRSNTLEISIVSPKSCEKIVGNAVWVSCYQQIKTAYKLIEKDSLLNKLPQNKKLDIAFATFYFGYSNVDTVRLSSHLKKLNISSDLQMKFINQLKELEHCEASKSYFLGISNKLGSFFNQYFSFINYVDRQKILSEDQKKEYIDMLNLQNDNFCQMAIYYYLNSSNCKKTDLNLSIIYNLMPSIDSTLLFHINTIEEEENIAFTKD